MDSIKGVIRISDDFGCSGQPTEGEFDDVRGSGVKLVVNLAMPDSDFALPDEQAVVELLGMDFLHIPVQFTAPTIEHFLHFERELLLRPGQKILVHCALNWRASAFSALYAERHLGWSREQADALRYALWTPNETWTAWAHSIRDHSTSTLCREQQVDPARPVPQHTGPLTR